MMKKISFITLVTCVVSSFALEGGPSQPDYAQFEPSGMTDMVSLQSGDFSYQIPLSDIPGPYGNYPLSLSYHAGISPQQEASWVGLGWSLNPGSINRDVRGVPDDQFHGGTLGFIYQYSVTQVWSVNLGYSNGVFSVGQTFSSDGSVGFSATIGPELSGIAGVGFTIGTDAIGVDASIGLGKNAGLNTGLMFSTKDGKPNAYVGASLSIAGASLGAQVSTGSGASARVGFGKDKKSVGLSVSSDGVSASIRSGETTFRQSRNGSSVSVGGSTTTISNSQTKGSNKSSTAGFAVIIPTNIGVFSFGFSQTTFEYWMRSATSEYLYGYIYQSGTAIDVSGENDVSGAPDGYVASHVAKNAEFPWNWTMKGRSLESMGKDDLHPAYDMYSVSSEGASGSFRPFAREKHQLHKKISNKWTNDSENIETYSTIMDDCNGEPCSDEFVYVTNVDGSKSLKKISEDPAYPDYLDYRKCLDLSLTDGCSMYAVYETNYRNKGNRLLFDSRDGAFEERGGMRFIFAGEGGGYYESDDVGDGVGRPVNKVSNRLLKKTLSENTVNSMEYALYGSKRVKPLFEDNSPMGKLEGFEVTTAEGSKYIFKQPVRSYLKVDYSINQPKGVPIFIDKSTNNNKDFWNNFLEGAKAVGKWAWEHLNPIKSLEDVYDFFFKAGELVEKCSTNKDSESDDYFFSYTVNMNPHATQWLITEIQGADYVALAHDTIGYNVKFHYTDQPAVYRWRTPYSKPGIDSKDLPNFRVAHDGLTPEGCDSKMYQASFGVKEYVYLKSIETSTHRVEFELNTEERVDGKGWGSQKSLIPIMVQASLGFEMARQPNSSTKYEYKPKWVYFNTPLPQSIENALYGDSISVQGLEIVKGFHAIGMKIEYDYQRSLNGLRVIPGTYGRTDMSESHYGLYKIAVDGDSFVADYSSFAYNQKPEKLDSIVNCGKPILVVGENGWVKQNPYIDWSEIIFSDPESTITSSPYDNQMRYLKKISYYRKGVDSAYKEYKFSYDYSLQPKTLNSYCEGHYPQNVDEIKESPDSVGVGICQSENLGNHLYGKLTLKSIRETGCQNGKCASLPPFVFSYNSPSATSTRISTKDGWIDFMQGIVTDKDGNNDEIAQYPDDYFKDFDDVDATILASGNTTDEYGFWSNMANVENHKVDQSFADFGAAAWSLNKVVDPTGGNLEVEYERDVYLNGEDHSKEVQTVEFSDFGECSDIGKNFGMSSEYAGKLCFEIKPLYWREQCLGPRAAHWDSEFPDGFNGDKYAYLDSMGVKIGSHIFFNMLADVKTKVKCGLFGIGRCSRTRSVSLMGDATLKAIYGNRFSEKQVLVFDRSYDDVDAYIVHTAKRINDNQNWSVKGGYGYLWTIGSYEKFKGGDLRVSKLTRHDLNLKSQTQYDYGDGGEMAQLPDSAYTTVLGNRFFGSKLSYAVPDIKMMPVSRVVGIDDNDLMYLPGARITYPKVSVNNKSENGSVSNGTTEFNYITPESGVPAEYISESAKNELKPFFKLNIRNVHTYEYSSWQKALRFGDFNDGHVFKISLVDKDKNVVYEDPDGHLPLSRTILTFRDDIFSLNFYSENIKNVRYIAVQSLQGDGTFNQQSVVYFDLKGEAGVKFEENPDMNSNKVWGDFNEIMLAVISENPYDQPHLSFAWFRSQKPGHYPIVYKRIEYASRMLSLNKMSYKAGFFGNQERPKYNVTTFPIDFERFVTYHDLTAFLGLNYKTVFKRGSGDNAIVIKKDSSYYSTEVPDIVASSIDPNDKYKVGRQVEKWSSEQVLQCTDNNKGHDENCKKQYMTMFMLDDAKITKDFTYIRYPAFQIGSVSFVGHDNQMNGTETNKFGKTELHNHAYDPLTGSPTATLATLNIENEMVSRKLTKKIPYYSIKDNDLSDSMFLRNMLTQNYMEAVYTDTLKPSGDTTWSTVAASNNNLRSFSISPYRFAGLPVADSLRPIVAWGTYNSKEEPKNIIDRAMIYANGDSLPSLVQYSGTEIVSINQNLKVTEIKDVLGRSMATLFSNDGMSQLSLFYPATQAEVGAVLPYRDTVLCLGQCNCSNLNNNFSVNNGIIQTGSGVVNLTCNAIPNAAKVVLEYRIKENGKSWETHRDTVAAGSAPGLTVQPWSKLNYFRVYPEQAESKTFLYDKYGNLVQTVAEDNTSTFYEYDPLGNLVQSRNDDGVSFKAHHREYMNDSTTQKVKGE